MRCVATDYLPQKFYYYTNLRGQYLFSKFFEIQFKLGTNANFGIKVDFGNRIDEIILHNAENMYIFAIERTN